MWEVTMLFAYRVGRERQIKSAIAGEVVEGPYQSAVKMLRLTA